MIVHKYYVLYTRLHFVYYPSFILSMQLLWISILHFLISCICSPLENNLRALIKHSRPYFPIEATHEMLEEWRPLMCPFDMTMVKAVSYLSNFLPTFNTQAVKDQTYGLWFDELVSQLVCVLYNDIVSYESTRNLKRGSKRQKNREISNSDFTKKS